MSEAEMQKHNPTNTADSGKVRLGAMSPVYLPVRTTPVNAADTGKVRLGAMSPACPPMGLGLR
jgi:hypothetical protein